MHAIELVALATAVDKAFSEMSDADIDRMLKEQNADVRHLMAAHV